MSRSTQIRRLETDRLFLRPFRKSDLDDLAALNGDAENMKFVSPPLAREQVAGIIDWFIAEWKRLGYGWFAVTHKRTERLLGQCGLQEIEDNTNLSTAELIFVIDRSVWGKGYATEAAGAVVRFGFEAAGVEKIAAVAIEENGPGRQVLVKLGFTHIDNRTLQDQEVMVYEMTKSSFVNQQCWMPESSRDASAKR
jgi:RimJ/RimL family protein N-acetyltransferase